MLWGISYRATNNIGPTTAAGLETIFCIAFFSCIT